jgi:predicted nucleic acid-binding protein
MLTLDTSGILALLNTEDPTHLACVSVVRDEAFPTIIPIAILAEIAWLLEQRFPPSVEVTLLQDIERGDHTLDWQQRDLRRITELVIRYQDLDLGLADAAVIACAERHGGRVLSTDRRHFPVVERGEQTISVLPLDSNA